MARRPVVASQGGVGACRWAIVAFMAFMACLGLAAGLRAEEAPKPPQTLLTVPLSVVVGEPVKVNIEILETIMKSDAIPVIAPVGVGVNGETFNVNADTAAGAIATATKAKRLLLLTDVAGVLDKDKNLISELSVEELPNLVENGTITGGMIPKVESAAAVVESGVEGVIILDGRVPHSVLLELLTPHGVGTRISRAGA